MSLYAVFSYGRLTTRKCYISFWYKLLSACTCLNRSLGSWLCRFGICMKRKEIRKLKTLKRWVSSLYWWYPFPLSQATKHENKLPKKILVLISHYVAFCLKKRDKFYWRFSCFEFYLVAIYPETWVNLGFIRFYLNRFTSWWSCMHPITFERLYWNLQYIKITKAILIMFDPW